MARPKTKLELMDHAQTSFDKLWSYIDSMPNEVLEREFDFSNDASKKEAHWARDKNLRDVLVHLYEWHQLLLNWINANSNGQLKSFLPAPYNWKNYGAMNVEFWEKHQSTTLELAKAQLKESHSQALSLVLTFDNQALFTKQHFDWTGSTSLGSYCISALSSHYEWALKKLKAHAKQVKLHIIEQQGLTESGKQKAGAV